MSKHIVFLLHGMGDTSSGWSQPLQEQLHKKYKDYKVSESIKLKNKCEFKELNYNHIFTSHIEKWQSNGRAVESQLEASGATSKTLSWLASISQATAKKEFLATHVLDVILYRYIKGIQSQIISHLSSAIVGTLNAHSVPGTVPSWSVICHSLGTAVMHDVMQANMTTDEFPLGSAHGTPVLYMTIANVSRILQDSDSDVYRSAVRPTLKDRSKLYSCHRFVNVRHELDPFTIPSRFNPPWKKGHSNPVYNLRKASNFATIETKGLTGINPHDLGHYLEHPQVHAEIFRNIVGNIEISAAEINKQAKIHEQRTLSGQFDALKDEVEKLKLTDRKSLSDAVAAWTRFQTTVRQLKDASNG